MAHGGNWPRFNNERDQPRLIRPCLTSERRARGLGCGADRELGSARPAAGGLPRSGARRPTLQRLPLARYSSRDWLEPIDGGPGAGATRSLELAAAHVHYGRKGRTSAQRRVGGGGAYASEVS